MEYAVYFRYTTVFYSVFQYLASSDGVLRCVMEYSGHPGLRALRNTPKQALLNCSMLFTVAGNIRLLVWRDMPI